jgi:hypothetical protein
MLRTAGDLKIEFFRAEDRFAHRIGIQQAGQTTWILQSLEGTAEQDWPTSPPLQDLSVEQQADREVIFLVGMAGKSHWSLSLELAPQQHGLLFDVACRAHQPPARLGSTYRRLDLSTTAAGLSKQPDLIELVPLDAPSPLVHRTAEELSLMVSTQSPRWPNTFRWRYEIRLRVT